MQKSTFLLSIIVLCLFAICLYLLSCNSRGKRISFPTSEIKISSTDSSSHFRFEKDGRFRGMHIHSDRNLTQAELLPLVRNNIEWIVHTPYLIQENGKSTEINIYENDVIDNHRYEQELLKSTSACNIKCVVKPLIWLTNPGDGEWRGNIHFKNQEDWMAWSEQYRSIILEQARTCEQMGVEAFCVGTELTSIVNSYPDFLRQLIKDVRQIYSGKLLYAANWDQEYEQVPFWDEVDYIGISAYFPLSKKPFPKVRHIKRGWKKHLSKIEALSKHVDKKVIFTEVGYRSTSQAADRPWEWVKDSPQLGESCSPQTQAYCYEALFQSCWNEEWFAGVFLWDWKIGATSPADSVEINFTVEGKAAEEVVARWFGTEMGK